MFLHRASIAEFLACVTGMLNYSLNKATHLIAMIDIAPTQQFQKALLKESMASKILFFVGVI